MRPYLRQHRDALALTLAQLGRTPWAHGLVIAVIAVTLALPTVFFVGLDAVQKLTANWPRGNDLTAYLKPDVGIRDGEALAQKIGAWTAVRSARYLSSAAALEAFTRRSGLTDAVAGLERNPLPASIAIAPKTGERPAIEDLAARLRAEPAVDRIQYDRAWASRLEAFLAVSQRTLAVVTLMLGLAVILVVGNTIRLLVAQRRDEIAVVQLIGGTPRYVRRPFLYLGLLLGVFGGLGAALVCLVVIASVEGPINILLATYEHARAGAGLSWRVVAGLTAGGAALGYVGARLAVGRAVKSLQ